MNRIVLIFVILALTLFGSSLGMPGGWRDSNIDDDAITSSAQVLRIVLFLSFSVIIKN